MVFKMCTQSRGLPTVRVKTNRRAPTLWPACRWLNNRLHLQRLAAFQPDTRHRAVSRTGAEVSLHSFAAWLVHLRLFSRTAQHSPASPNTSLLLLRLLIPPKENPTNSLPRLRRPSLHNLTLTLPVFLFLSLPSDAQENWFLSLPWKHQVPSHLEDSPPQGLGSSPLGSFSWWLLFTVWASLSS